ncbi:hypothetical protein [Nocardioides sp.]|uniref:hypothetical protein n=1 Tax=Nocardioides sp. TaxID=35761 RepID=UPI00271A62E5|nr:hypothetical protein [Nocardioides sp.]MDO9455724.1 hypothetical protein [Nocardioides sp.]
MGVAAHPHPPLRGARLGSLVGVVGGLVFVLVNAGPLPGSTAWRVAGVAAAIGVVVLSLTRPAPADAEPSRAALRTYLLSVGAMVVAVPAGSAVLRAVDQQDLVLPWVVAVVGLHFVPFAAAFTAPVFRVLGLALVAIAVAGVVAGLAGWSDAAAATGLAAGFALLVAAGAPYARTRPATPR